MVGTIVTEPLQHIEAGSIGILLQGETILGICTVLHLNAQGEWVVSGDWKPFRGEIKEDMTLCRLVIQSESGKWPLRFTQWSKSIRAKEINTGVKVEFKLQSAKFVPGNYTRICSECQVHFLADKRQPRCETCCGEDKIAQIVLTKEKPKPTVKEKRQRMISIPTAKLMMREAYKLGVEGVGFPGFEKWLEKTFENGTNIIGNTNKGGGEISPGGNDSRR